jgi:hypothetical protein
MHIFFVLLVLPNIERIAHSFVVRNAGHSFIIRKEEWAILSSMNRTVW